MVLKIDYEKDTDVQQSEQNRGRDRVRKSGPCACAEPERERCVGHHRVTRGGFVKEAEQSGLKVMPVVTVCEDFPCRDDSGAR